MTHALIIIDLIEDYFDASIWPESAIPGKREAIVGATNEAVEICRSRGVPIVWIRQEFKSDFSDAFPHAKKGGRRYALRGTPGAALMRELDVRPTDANVAKTRFSAFYGTDLEEDLRGQRISTVILAGITTAWCVRSTAVDAYQMGFDVILASDCMAAFDDAAHRESLAAMNGYIATCLTNIELDGYLDALKPISGARGK